MKPLSHHIANLLSEALRAAQASAVLPAFEPPTIVIERPKREGQGDYASPVAMSLAKALSRKPREVAEAVVQHLPPAPFIAQAEIAGPGFINFTLSDDFLRQQVETIIALGDDWAKLDLFVGKRAQVEFVSANPSGPITVGHTRNAVLGDAIARVLEAAGYQVQREYYFNNAGNQMVMLGQSVQARYLQILGQSAELPENGYQGEYIIDLARDLVQEHGDSLREADWKVFKDYAEARMFAWIKRSLALIDIQHDAFFNENSLFENGEVWRTLEILRENGYIYSAAEWEGASEEEKAKAAGRAPAQWFRSTRFGDDKDRVLVKSDGVPTYTLPDIAYHRNKIERGFDLMVNVLGADHGQQYKVVANGIRALGLDPSKIKVILYQMVRIMRNGVEVRMSKRKGNFDTLDDLVEQTSADAVRYHLLGRSPGTTIDFDLDAVVKQSNENPVYYIQNAHVRCAGIAREAAARGLDDTEADLSLLGQAELKFLRKALELSEVIELAATEYEPHRLAYYAQELAALFHPLYDEVRALHSDVEPQVARARLRFYRAARLVFRRVLRLMGMSAPERM
ncbi:MAG: arginine--tRNA ligase [Anaerolineae bacterium]|nr:arginine--tRNA ligase [Anaerolineae bacterium]MDW8171479.1 arginine--tRNA ligase [Anaerolineae bacterium]